VYKLHKFIPGYDSSLEPYIDLSKL